VCSFGTASVDWKLKYGSYWRVTLNQKPAAINGDLPIMMFPNLLVLAAEKLCGFQQRSRRNLFCLTPSLEGSAAVYYIEERWTAPRHARRAATHPGVHFLRFIDEVVTIDGFV
jgi:hypothetical protein